MALQEEKSFKFHPYEIRVYIIDYKKKEHHHHHRHSYDKTKHSTIEPLDAQATQTPQSRESLTKKQRAALETLEQLSNNASSQLDVPASPLKAVEDENVVPPDSPAIDLENETIEQKRERQRSIVLNLGKRCAPQVEGCKHIDFSCFH
jgi:hypothetical protein